MNKTSKSLASILIALFILAAFTALTGATSSSIGIKSTPQAGRASGSIGNALSTSSITQLPGIPLGPVEPFQGTYDPTNKLLYVTDIGDSLHSLFEGLTAINGTNWVYTFPVCSGTLSTPRFAAYDSANDKVYVACIVTDRTGTVAVVDPHSNTVITQISLPTGLTPGYVLYDPAIGDIYVGDISTTSTSNAVVIISGQTNKVVATINTPGPPIWLVYSPADNDIYALDEFSTPAQVTVIDGARNKLITNIKLDSGFNQTPNSAIYDPANQDVYITCGSCSLSPGQSGYVFAISPSNKIVASVYLGFNAGFSTEWNTFLAYNSANNNVYVAAINPNTNPISNFVGEISSATNTVIGSVTFPASCNSTGCFTISYVTFDPVNQDLYISGPRDNITIVSSSLSVLQQIDVSGPPTSTCIAPYAPLASAFNPANNEVYVFCTQGPGTIIPLTS